jgi:hypothetical protein
MKSVFDGFAFPFNVSNRSRYGKYLASQIQEEYYAVNLLSGATFGPFVLHPGDYCAILQDNPYLLRKRENQSSLFKFEKGQVQLQKQFQEIPIYFSASSAGIVIVFPSALYFLSSTVGTTSPNSHSPSRVSASNDEIFKLASSRLPTNITYGNFSNDGLLLLADNEKYIFLSLSPSSIQILYSGSTPTQSPVLSVTYSDYNYQAVLMTKELSLCFSLNPNESTKIGYESRNDFDNDLFSKESEVYSYLPNLEDTIMSSIGYEIVNDILMKKHKDSLLLWLSIQIMKFLHTYEKNLVTPEEVFQLGILTIYYYDSIIILLLLLLLYFYYYSSIIIFLLLFFYYYTSIIILLLLYFYTSSKIILLLFTLFLFFYFMTYHDSSLIVFIQLN